MSVVDKCKENVLLSGGQFHAPFLLVCIEVKAYAVAFGFGCDGVSAAVALDEIAALFAFNDFCSGSKRIAAAPEFDAVYYKDVGQPAYFINGEYPECEKHEFVEELVAYPLVPVEQAV